jgi:hypothetical protein
VLSSQQIPNLGVPIYLQMFRDVSEYAALGSYLQVLVTGDGNVVLVPFSVREANMTARLSGNYISVRAEQFRQLEAARIGHGRWGGRLSHR